MSGCCFCPIQKLTEWYFPDGSVKSEDDKTPTYPDGTVVCKDLNPRSFKYRLLCVMQGEKYHRPKDKYSQKEIDLMIQRLWKVVLGHLDQGKAKNFAGFDSEHFTIKDHFHIQGKIER